MKRLLLLVALLASTSQSAVAPDREFAEHWNRFARPMTDYIEGLKEGLVRSDKLEDAIHAWRKLEHDQNWDQIR